MMIYYIHMALQVFSGFETTKKAPGNVAQGPCCSFLEMGGIHEVSLQFAQIHHSPLVCECPTKMQFEKEFEKKATHESLCKSYLFLLPRLSLDHHLITSS